MARFRGNVSVHRHEAYVAILMRGLLSRQRYLASVGVSTAARGMRQKTGTQRAWGTTGVHLDACVVLSTKMGTVRPLKYVNMGRRHLEEGVMDPAKVSSGERER